jgi:DNA-binding SARP family transcriptional activator
VGLRIYTLGPFRIYSDDTPIADSAWKTQKHKTLLKILLTQRGHVLTKDQLIEWLWPDLDLAAAGRNLRVAISHVRHALEPDLAQRSHSRYVLHTEGGYRWNTQTEYWLDAQEFESRYGQFETGEQNLQRRIEQAERARALYQGDYLEGDRYADWAATERERLRELYFSLLTQLAELYALQGRYRRAVALCREVLAADRCRESIWCQLMLYHYHAGDPSLALRAYDECRQTLAEELSVEPLAETVALAQQIRQRAVAGERPYPPPAATEHLRQLPVSLGRMPFIGREREFAELVHCWDAVRMGGGAVVIIEGEAGIGKTRLAQEFLNYAEQQGALLLEGQGREVEGTLPYQPLLDALRAPSPSAQAVAVDLDPIWKAELSRLLPELRMPEFDSPRSGHEPGRLFEALMRYILALRASRPEAPGLILFVDDLHWADEATTEFLLFFGHRLADHPVLLLGAVRPEETEPKSLLRTGLRELRHAGLLHSVTLEPLAADAVTRLVRQISHASPAASPMTHRLYQQTQGHPLFLIAQVQALFEDGLLYMDEAGRWCCDDAFLQRDDTAVAVPREVSDLIVSRIQRLDVRAQQLLALAAVIGRPFNAALIERAGDLSEEDLLNALETLLERRLLSIIDAATPQLYNAKYDLSHDLIRHVVYQSLSPHRRVLLHRRILLALEDQQLALDTESVGDLARHAIEGQLWDQALPYCKRAADLALDRFALHEALRQCERGLTALEALASSGGTFDSTQQLLWQYDLLAAQQLAAHLQGQRDPALITRLIELARQMGDRERLAQAYYTRMRHDIDTGQNQAAVELVPLYAPIIAQGVSATTAIGYHQRVGFLYYRMGQLQQALEHHNEALRLAHEAQDPHQQAIVLNTRGTVLMCLGRYAEALGDFTRAAEFWNSPTRRLQRTFALDNRGDVYYYLGCYEEDLQAKEMALPVYREFAYPIAEAECLSDTGACLRAMGRTAEAEKYLHKALDLSQSLQDGYDLVQSLNGLALLHVERDDLASWRLAEEYARRAAIEAERADLPHGVIQGSSYQALACLKQGRPTEALVFSTKAVDLLRARRHIEGAEEEIYFIHSQTLAANDHRIEARKALQEAYGEMMAKADRLTDPELLRSFLERVQVNRTIREVLSTAND